MYDPGLLLQDVSRVIRDISPARHATVGILDKDRRAITVGCAKEIDAPAVMPVILVLRSAVVTHKPLEPTALRLRDVTSEGWVRVTVSVLGVPISGGPHLQGLLFLRKGLPADESNPESTEPT